MENATKALLIASGVLIGIMIISLGVSLYASLSGYVESTQKEMINNKIQQFNQQFTKYINYNEKTCETEFRLTIQDVITAANLANENNKKYGLESYENNNYYVTIVLSGKFYHSSNLEKAIEDENKVAEILATEFGQQFRCGYNDVKINPETGRVYEVRFRHKTP